MEERYFYLKDGTAIKNIEEFYDALSWISDEDFNKHVSSEKNDFASWVKDSFNEEELANKLSTAKTKDGMNEVLEKFLGIHNVSIGKTLPELNAPEHKPTEEIIKEKERDLDNSEKKPRLFTKLFGRKVKKEDNGTDTNSTE